MNVITLVVEFDSEEEYRNLALYKDANVLGGRLVGFAFDNLMHEVDRLEEIIEDCGGCNEDF